MLPICGVPASIQQGLAPYRDLFCRDEGFAHISRYITGLILSPNKTLQGIYDLQVWDTESPSRRAMHAAVFEAQWDAEALMPRHRAVVAQDHGRRGREIISLDWTLAHHEWGPKIYGVTKSYDYVERRMARFQTVVTAVVANRALVDGVVF
jgi:DDE superfamily endonuclease